VRRGWPAAGRELPLVTEGFDTPALPGAKRYLTNGHEMALSWLGSLPSRFSGGAISIPRGTGQAKCYAGVLTITSSSWDRQGAGKSMLARRLTTILPAMTLAEAVETTRIHRVAGLTGDRTALVTTRPFRAPYHTISDAGLIGAATCPCRAKCHWPTMACSFSMNCPSSAAMCWRCCGNRWRRVTCTYNFVGVLDVNLFATLAARHTTAGGSSRG
jgi:hypothetical protein